MGFATGAAYGLVALDIDPRSGGDDALEALVREHGSLPRTVTTMTGGGGRHLLFRAPAAPVRILNSIGALGSGLDLRGERGLVVAPPSLHASGGSYEFASGQGLSDLPLADLPQWIVVLVASRRAADRSRRAGAGSGKRRRPAPRGGISAGERNTTLISVAGRLRAAAYLSSTACEDALQAINAADCTPPLSRSEVSGIARSAERFGGPPPWRSDPHAFFGDSRLGASARHVLRVLCDHVDEEGECFPSYRRLQRQSGLAKGTVMNSVRELESVTRLEVIRSPRKVNHYHVKRFLPQTSPRDGNTSGG